MGSALTFQTIFGSCDTLEDMVDMTSEWKVRVGVLGTIGEGKCRVVTVGKCDMIVTGTGVDITLSLV